MQRTKCNSLPSSNSIRISQSTRLLSKRMTVLRNRLALLGVCCVSQFMAWNLYILHSLTSSKIKQVIEGADPFHESLKDVYGPSEKKSAQTDLRLSETRPTSSSSIRGVLTNTTSSPIIPDDAEKSPSNCSSREPLNELTPTTQTACHGTTNLTE